MACTSSVFTTPSPVPRMPPRKLRAADALKVPVPVSLSKNVPLQVNRARLAAIAGDYATFQALRNQLDGSRTERFEVEGLDRVWMDHKQGKE